MSDKTTLIDPLLAQVRIVLVETSHPGNIGAAARAMKTMGLSQLCLVNPKQFPCAEATVRASGADDLLARAHVSETLEQALEGCGMVYGTSARSRSIDWPTFSPWDVAQRVLHGTEDAPAEALRGEVAIVFGRENSGLDNEELELCSARVLLPTNPDFSSLNLASAVQVLAYELSTHSKRGQAEVHNHVDETYDPLATQGELQGFFAALEKYITDIDYFDPAKPKQLIRRLHRLFNRASMSRSEVQILRGIITAANKAIGK